MPPGSLPWGQRLAPCASIASTIRSSSAFSREPLARPASASARCMTSINASATTPSLQTVEADAMHSAVASSRRKWMPNSWHSRPAPDHESAAAWVHCACATEHEDAVHRDLGKGREQSPSRADGRCNDAMRARDHTKAARLLGAPLPKARRADYFKGARNALRQSNNSGQS